MSRLIDYSDPYIAQQNAFKYLGKDAILYESTRRDKKYMIRTPDDKWVHFGFFGMEDYTKHKDLLRRDAFRKRNKKWSTAPVWSPAWLSYYILW